MSHKQDREENIRLNLIKEENEKLPQAYLDKKAQWARDEEEQRLEGEEIRRQCTTFKSACTQVESLNEDLKRREQLKKDFLPLVSYLQGEIKMLHDVLRSGNLEIMGQQYYRGKMVAFQETLEEINSTTSFLCCGEKETEEG